MVFESFLWHRLAFELFLGYFIGYYVFLQQ
jgi:hypothetical protein